MIGYAFCGSFCTLSKSFLYFEKMVRDGFDVLPIVSENVYSIDTRFQKASDFCDALTRVSGRELIHTVVGAEPLGPKISLEALVICPCTGNTLAKIANGINDTAVTMAVKAHVRNNKPVVIGISTNDGLGLNLKNLGTLFAAKNFYFVPFGQDDHNAKPKSLVADWNLIEQTIAHAKQQKQIQPILI